MKSNLLPKILSSPYRGVGLKAPGNAGPVKSKMAANSKIWVMCTRNISFDFKGLAREAIGPSLATHDGNIPKYFSEVLDGGRGQLESVKWPLLVPRARPR